MNNMENLNETPGRAMEVTQKPEQEKTRELPVALKKAGIHRALALLLNAGKPEKVILFGSYAKGTWHKNSDVDFLIIEETNLSRVKRGITYGLALMDFDKSKDIVVRTPEEFARSEKIKNTLEYFVAKEGLVLYER